MFPTFTDPVNLPKFIALTSMSFALTKFTRDAKGRKYALKLPNTPVRAIFQDPVQVAITLFIIGLFASTVSSSSPFTGFFGLAGRRNGFITYFAMFLLFLVAKKISTSDTLSSFMQALALVGSFQASYMLIQFCNLDPIAWTMVHENKMFGTFGNPNFSSAFLAISLPAMIYCSSTQTIPKKIKYLHIFGACATILALILSGVYQGLISVILALLTVISVFVYNLFGFF